MILICLIKLKKIASTYFNILKSIFNVQFYMKLLINQFKSNEKVKKKPHNYHIGIIFHHQAGVSRQR